jgi:hypothetical protein
LQNKKALPVTEYYYLFILDQTPNLNSKEKQKRKHTLIANFVKLFSRNTQISKVKRCIGLSSGSYFLGKGSPRVHILTIVKMVTSVYFHSFSKPFQRRLEL